MKSIARVFALVALLVATSETLAQDGPFVPCPDCETRKFTPYPDSGPWANTNQTGSGLLLNIQNGVLVGFYFGYDSQGRPEWLLFNGVLQPGEPESDVLWSLEAPLSRFSGGSCPSCEYTAPQNQDAVGLIQLKFFQRNHAAFQIDDNAEQFMVPLLFGSAGYQRFADHTPYLVPELGGEGEDSVPWIIYYSKGAVWQGYLFHSVIVHLRASEMKFSESLGNYVEFRSIEEFSLADPPPRILTIQCYDASGEGEVEVLCRVGFHYIPYSDQFQMPLANLGANSFYAENEEGDKLVGIRLRYD